MHDSQAHLGQNKGYWYVRTQVYKVQTAHSKEFRGEEHEQM